MCKFSWIIQPSYQASTCWTRQHFDVLSPLLCSDGNLIWQLNFLTTFFTVLQHRDDNFYTNAASINVLIQLGQTQVPKSASHAVFPTNKNRQGKAVRHKHKHTFAHEKLCPIVTLSRLCKREDLLHLRHLAICTISLLLCCRLPAATLCNKGANECVRVFEYVCSRVCICMCVCVCTCMCVCVRTHMFLFLFLVTFLYTCLWLFT
jgi:hypothetical protein